MSIPLYNSSNDPQRHPDNMELDDDPNLGDESDQDDNEGTEPKTQTTEHHDDPTINATEARRPELFDEEFDDLNIEDHK